MGLESRVRKCKEGKATVSPALTNQNRCWLMCHTDLCEAQLEAQVEVGGLGLRAGTGLGLYIASLHVSSY